MWRHVRIVALALIIAAMSLFFATPATATPAPAEGTTINGAALADVLLAGRPFDERNVDVIGDVQLPSGSVVHGSLRCLGCRFHGRIAAEGTAFDGLVDLTGSRVAGPVDMSGASFARSLIWSNALMEGDANFGGAQFEGAVSFADTNVRGKTDFSRALFELGAIFTGEPAENVPDPWSGDGVCEKKLRWPLHL